MAVSYTPLDVYKRQGLIGGSLALKLREKKFDNQFIVTDKSEIHLQEARKKGIIDKAENLENGVKMLNSLL